MTRKSRILVVLVCLAAVSSLDAQRRRLDPTNFIVMGEGLAAGMSNFSLSEEIQSQSFPAQMARQMQTAFPQPLFQAPGIGSLVGFPSLPISPPSPLQTTLRPFPPTLFVFNLSVPGMKVADSLRLRPVSPLVHQHDAKQTAINMILGFPALVLEADVPLWTQLEYAEQMRPTFTLVELGYQEVLEAAVKGDLSLLPGNGSFRSDYSKILSTLKGVFSEVVVMTIPNPIDTAYFSPIDKAAKLLKIPPLFLLGLYGLQSDDLVTVPGLSEIGNQLIGRKIQPLPSGSFVTSVFAGEINNRVQALNAEIISLAQEHGARVYGLNGFFRRIRMEGAFVGLRRLSGDYLGGFYLLNGFYPGTTGHALIANELLEFLSRTYGQSFSPVDVSEVLRSDSATMYEPAPGPEYTLEDLKDLIPQSLHDYLFRLGDKAGSQ